MPYVGNPLANAFSSRVKQDLTGQSGTSFTLTHAVSSANDLSVYINHVRQEPTTAYTVDYNTLTTTGSVAGTDDFYIIYDELGLQSIAHDSAQAMKATSGTFTGAITTTQMASSGPVSGTTGTFSGAISGTLGTAAQPNITSTGTLTSLNVSGNIELDGGDFVFNNSGAAKDFRIEGDTIANLFTVDGSEDDIGMGQDPTFTSGNGLHLADNFKIGFGAGGNSRPDFQLGYSSSTDRLQLACGFGADDADLEIDTGGRVGIGRTPVAHSGYNNLVIGGGLSTTGSMIELYDSGGTRDGKVYAKESDLYVSGEDRLYLNGAGTAGIVVESDGQCTISKFNETAGNNHAHLTLSYHLASSIGGFQMYTYSYYSDVNFRIQNNDTNGGRNHNDMAFIRSGATRGSISIHTGSTSFNTTSDYRMKKDEKPITNAIDTVKKLKPYNFNWKDSGINEDGFFAHEVDEVLDYVVTGKKDAVKTYENVVLNKDGFMVDSDVTKEQYEKRINDKDNEDGSPIGETTYPKDSTWKETHEDVEAQQMDSSKLVPILTAALQEAIKRIEVLESK